MSRRLIETFIKYPDQYEKSKLIQIDGYRDRILLKRRDKIKKLMEKSGQDLDFTNVTIFEMYFTKQSIKK